MAQIAGQVPAELFRFGFMGVDVALEGNPAGAFVQRHHGHQFHQRLTGIPPRIGLQTPVDGVGSQADDFLLVRGGSGQVECAHGIMPVPAPATALILEGIPIYGGEIQGELCTPTGAALLKYFANRFGSMPAMTVDKIGYGMGKKDFPAANCVRAMLGESSDKTETVSELSCNVDDMTAEEIGFAMEQLFAGGANEVYTIPVGMKKNRPGTLIRVMCSTDDVDKMVRLLYKYTSTIGVRETLTRRFILDRKIDTVKTEYGDVRVKTSTGYGVTRSKYEFDDLSRIAKEKGMSLSEVRALIEEK